MNDLMTSTETNTMSSKEIAALTGKPHNDVLKAIRAMEPAWQKVTGGNFSLSEYKDASGRKLPQYELSKTECLFIATKFNDEARAKLIMRWEELENMNLESLISNPDLIIRLATNYKKERTLRQVAETQHALAEEVIKEQAPKVAYHDQVLISERTYTTTTIAKELGTAAISFHKELNKRGIMYKADGHWVLYHKHQGKGYTKTRTAVYTDRYGKQQSTLTTVWTEKGREWLHKLFQSWVTQEN